MEAGSDRGCPTADTPRIGEIPSDNRPADRDTSSPLSLSFFWEGEGRGGRDRRGEDSDRGGSIEPRVEERARLERLETSRNRGNRVDPKGQLDDISRRRSSRYR